MKRIVLGSGKIFTATYDGETIPEDSVIEADANRLGHIKGGATLEYTPSFYEAKDDSGEVSEVYLTDETAFIKAGVMTLDGNTFKRISATARVEEKDGVRTTKIGGVGNFDNSKYIIRFVHTDKKKGDIRVTIIGQNRAGWTMTFKKEEETVLGCEFAAMSSDSEGTLITLKETLPETA